MASTVTKSPITAASNSSIIGYVSSITSQPLFPVGGAILPPESTGVDPEAGWGDLSDR